MNYPHTPAPWHVGRGGFLNANRVWSADSRPICNLVSFGDSPPDIDPTAQANARLIAAAPDLLAALQAFVEQATKVSGFPQAYEPYVGALVVARAAIAKATK